MVKYNLCFSRQFFVLFCFAYLTLNVLFFVLNLKSFCQLVLLSVHWPATDLLTVVSQQSLVHGNASSGP